MPESMSNGDDRRKAPLPGATVSQSSKAELEWLKKKQKIQEALAKAGIKKFESDQVQMEKRLAELKQKFGDKQLTAQEQRQLDIAQAAYDEALKNQELLHDREVQLAKEAEEEKQKQKEANQAKLEENMDKLSEAFANRIANLSSELDSIMDRFLESQESIAYNLNGTGKSFDDINDNLTSALAGTGIVKQENVYKNLQALVEAGIVYDAESRAFLATLSDDLGMGFNMQSAALNRLINLQNSDMADNRMAIQASLKTFLNQNYQTSQYIREGFESVSEALIESQSFMSSAQASAYEAAVQTWMGSLSSSGLSSNTISSLTQAIDQLGSGNIFEQNGTAMQKLVVLGANRAGLEYGTLMIDGINEGVVNALMGGITSFVNETIASGGNNVVMSGLAQAFGISFADIKAFQNYASSATSGSVTDDINSALLDKTDDYVYFTKKISNMLENFMYQWGTSIASDEAYFTIYKTLETVSGLAAAVLDGQEATLSVLGNGLNIDLGQVARLVPLITALPALVGTGISSIGNMWHGNTGAAAIFNALGGSSDGKAAVAGNIGGYSKGASTSGSAVIGNTDTTDIGKSALTSATATSEDIVKPDEEIFDADDIYRLIDPLIDPMQDHWLAVDIGVGPDGAIYGNISNVVNSIDNLKETTSSGFGLIDTHFEGVTRDYWVAIGGYLSSTVSQLDTYFNGVTRDYWIAIGGYLAAEVNQLDSNSASSFANKVISSANNIYTSITKSDGGVISAIGNVVTAIENQNISSIGSTVANSIGNIFSGSSGDNSSGLFGKFTGALSGIQDSIINAVSSLTGSSQPSQQSYVSVSTNYWDDRNVKNVRDASVVTAFNTQNIYNLLLAWFKANKYSSDYVQYNTDAIDNLTYTNYSTGARSTKYTFSGTSQGQNVYKPSSYQKSKNWN